VTVRSVFISTSSAWLGTLMLVRAAVDVTAVPPIPQWSVVVGPGSSATVHGMAAPDEVDEAIAQWLRDESPAAWTRVLRTGPEALLRAVELFYTRTSSPVVHAAAQQRHDRELVDAWAVLLGGLAHEHPEVYLAELAAGRIQPAATPLLETAILARIEQPAAVPWLLRFREHPDPYVRRVVVAGLAGHADPAARSTVEDGVMDADRMVRDEAAQWVQRRDPEAAAALYQRLLGNPALDPELRDELTQRLATARRLATMRRNAAADGA
jgi:hypothetical protein